MSVKPLILEGCIMKQLETYSGPIGDHPLWICKYLLEAPREVIRSHKDYLAAGTDLLYSLSYQLSIEGLMKHYKFSVEEATEKLHESVELARIAWSEFTKEHPEEKNRQQLVVGSAGSYGATLHDGSEYTGSFLDSVNEDALVDWHRPRAKVLVDAGADFLIFETIPSVVEGRAVVRLLREFPNTKAWVSFSVKDGKSTSRGEPFGASVCEVWQKGREQLLAVGCNCCPPDSVTGLFQQIKDETRDLIPLVAYPNSGETFNHEKGWCGERCEYAHLAPQWIDAGVRYIGGCCRSDVRDTLELRKVIDDKFSNQSKAINLINNIVE